MNSVYYIRPDRCCQLLDPSSTDMFYCLIASYNYVIEHCDILSNLKEPQLLFKWYLPKITDNHAYVIL
jgi:hypothetical protein